MSASPPRRRAPLIGVTVELLEAPHYSGRRRFQLFTDYLPCLRAAGLVPLLLPSDGPEAEAEAWLDQLDGLLLSGGDDFDLRRLGGPPPPPSAKPVPPSQQALNLALVRGAAARGMPLLGICFGMQALGLAHGAPFLQDLPAEGRHRDGGRHPVRPVPGTRLAALLGEEEVEVASFHHQALAGPGPELAPAAWAPDGLLEAVERPGPRFCLGVQWHPERLPDSAPTRALFSGFAAAAGSYLGSRP